MLINFECDKITGCCTTLCKFSKNVYVGSLFCQECKYNISTDLELNIVECNAKNLKIGSI